MSVSASSLKSLVNTSVSVTVPVTGDATSYSRAVSGVLQHATMSGSVAPDVFAVNSDVFFTAAQVDGITLDDASIPAITLLVKAYTT